MMLRFLRQMVVVAVVMASAPPLALARFLLNPLSVAPGHGAAVPAALHAHAVPAVLHAHAVAAGGFAWGDAGIGAGAVLVIAGAAAIAAATRRRHPHQPAIG